MNRPTFSPAQLLSWVASVSLLLSSDAGAKAAEIVESKTSYESKDKTIAVERFEPKAPGKYPAVVVLHGAGGMRPEGFGWAFREYAKHLARQGYVTHVIHYFDRTGHEVVLDPKVMREHFAAWMETVADGVTHLSKQPNVDPKRIGLLGFSLGAYLSLSLATLDERVRAVVEYFGGLPEDLAKGLKRMPPTLILHGDADSIVPVKEARALERLFQEKQVPFEIKIYPGQGHGFIGKEGTDALTRATAFFDKHVKNEGPKVD